MVILEFDFKSLDDKFVNRVVDELKSHLFLVHFSVLFSFIFE